MHAKEEENIMSDKYLTGKAWEYRKNGWKVCRKYLRACHVVEWYYRRSENEEWRLLGRYAY